MATTNSPALPTIKRLLALSGNRCAFPRCSHPLADPGGKTFIGEICHIRAANDGGPRFDSAQSSAERHAFENLVLMCATHHTVIDQDPESYTVERLTKIKVQHEESGGPGSALPDEALLLAISGSVISGVIAGQVAHSIQNVTNVHPSGSPLSAAIEKQRDIGIKAYALLQQAVDGAVEIASMFQRRPDFRDSLRDDGVARRYLSIGCAFSETQVEAVMEMERPEQRLRVFSQIEDRRRFHSVLLQYFEFYQHVSGNGPMLPASVYDALLDSGMVFRRALVPLEMALDPPQLGGIDNHRWRASDELEVVRGKVMQELRNVLRIGLGIPDPSAQH